MIDIIFSGRSEEDDFDRPTQKGRKAGKKRKAAEGGGGGSGRNRPPTPPYVLSTRSSPLNEFEKALLVLAQGVYGNKWTFISSEFMPWRLPLDIRATGLALGPSGEASHNCYLQHGWSLQQLLAHSTSHYQARWQWFRTQLAAAEAGDAPSAAVGAATPTSVPLQQQQQPSQISGPKGFKNSQGSLHKALAAIGAGSSSSPSSSDSKSEPSSAAAITPTAAVAAAATPAAAGQQLLRHGRPAAPNGMQSPTRLEAAQGCGQAPSALQQQQQPMLLQAQLAGAMENSSRPGLHTQQPPTTMFMGRGKAAMLASMGASMFMASGMASVSHAQPRHLQAVQQGHWAQAAAAAATVAAPGDAAAPAAGAFPGPAAAEAYRAAASCAVTAGAAAAAQPATYALHSSSSSLMSFGSEATLLLRYTGHPHHHQQQQRASSAPPLQHAFSDGSSGCCRGYGSGSGGGSVAAGAVDAAAHAGPAYGGSAGGRGSSDGCCGSAAVGVTLQQQVSWQQGGHELSMSSQMLPSVPPPPQQCNNTGADELHGAGDPLFHDFLEQLLTEPSASGLLEELLQQDLQQDLACLPSSESTQHAAPHAAAAGAEVPSSPEEEWGCGSSECDLRLCLEKCE